MHTNATHLPNKQNPFYPQSVSCFFIPPSKHFSQVRPLLTHIHFPHIQAHSEILISVTSAQNKFSSKAPKTTVTIPPSRAFICCQNGIFFPHENQSISPKRPLLPSRRQQPPQALLSPASRRARCSPCPPAHLPSCNPAIALLGALELSRQVRQDLIFTGTMPVLFSSWLNPIPDALTCFLEKKGKKLLFFRIPAGVQKPAGLSGRTGFTWLQDHSTPQK